MKANRLFSRGVTAESFGIPIPTESLIQRDIVRTAKCAVHRCVIERSWIEGQAVPDFEVPKNCIKAKATLHDVRLNPMNCELQALFLIQMVFGDGNAKFEGWAGSTDQSFPTS